MEPSRLISFIIPCYNGEDFAIGCIKSILAQKIPEPLQFEIILVDNNSTDGTVLKVKSTFGDRVKVVHQPIQGRSHARNLGFQNSKGKFLCFVDVDVELSQDWFLNCYEAIKKNPDWSIVSTIIKLKSIEDTWFERWRVSGPKVQYENSVLRMNRYSPCINTAATIMRRDLFEKVGGFDVNFDYFEDLDIAREIGILGDPIITAPAVAYCYSGMNALSYLKRYYNIGKMAPKFNYKWDSKNELASKLGTLWYYTRYLINRFSLRFRIDYTLYMMLVLLSALIGAFVGSLQKFTIKKAAHNNKNTIKIIDKEQVIWITVKTGKFRILDLRKLVNPHARIYNKTT